MQIAFLIVGILVVAIAFERSKRLGSLLLAIVVLSLLLTGRKKGVV